MKFTVLRDHPEKRLFIKGIAGEGHFHPTMAAKQNSSFPLQNRIKGVRELLIKFEVYYSQM